MRIKKILLNNVGLKFLALVLAMVTWFYIEEATKLDTERTILQKLLSSPTFISKKLYIKPNFIGQVPQGYYFRKDDFEIIPEFILVVGPLDVLSEKEFIFTKPIDLREHTISKTLNVELEDVSRSLRFRKTRVQVHLPIEKLEEEK